MKSGKNFLSSKLTTYYVFEKKIGAYVKDSAEKSYKKTIRAGKFDKVCFTNLLYQQLIDSVVDYLRHHQISK